MEQPLFFSGFAVEGMGNNNNNNNNNNLFSLPQLG
jgi:hypothetical protein